MARAPEHADQPDHADHVVLAVHGVAHRTPADFSDEIDLLASDLAPRLVRPVFWGDLGPGDASNAFPDPASATMLDKNADLADAVDETAARIAARVDGPVPDATVAVVRSVLDDAARAGTRIEEPVVSEALADAIVLAPPSGSAALPAAGDHGGVLDSVRLGLRRIVSAVDSRLDQLSPEALVDGARRTIARTVRDVEAYERNGDAIRARLDAEYRAVAASAERVDIVAHSLGALVATEWLFGASAGAAATRPDERRIHTFITFGSQVSLFCEVRGIEGAIGVVHPPPTPVDLTLPLRRWSNVWHILDPLAYAVAPVLRVTGHDGPVTIDEYKLDVGRMPTSASFHTIYWRDERVLSWLPRVL
jgi:hypothetical protein